MNHTINSPFALVRFPKNKNFFLLSKSDTGTNTYSFVSFDSSKKHEFTFSKPFIISYSDIENLSIPLIHNDKTEVISKEDYIKLLEKTIRFLNAKNALKIVISREKWISKTKINPISSFLSLCNQYPNSFCHLSYWNNMEIWLGATPETLASYKNSDFKTMALAGTLPNHSSFEWSEKEIREQDYVSKYIFEKLNHYGSNISIEGPTSLYLNHIKHLVTYFSCQLENKKNLPNLLNSLHPTPAVCGLPLGISKDFILNEEGYNRDFYTGYIGIEMENSKEYFVNLRSGKLFSNGALLFVGGGITSQSITEKEWEETELKAKFIRNCL